MVHILGWSPQVSILLIDLVHLECVGVSEIVQDGTFSQATFKYILSSYTLPAW